MVKSLLKSSPEARPTANKALQNKWIRKYFMAEGSSREDIFNGLMNLQIFRTQMTLQKAVLSYIASQELTKSEEERLKEAFDSIDKDKNGCISKEELIEGYKMMGRAEIRAQLDAEYVMTRLDMNRNGTIDYNEFLMANLITYNVLTKDKLKKAFDFFDTVILFLID
jgi:calcium-dependent protein kinase